ncbi:MAG: serine/threonine protein kinase, partial [Deltaproteobacteria bacterium]|nr:serine/threonine protein kinase [Deltaproteobacteria bacterium]
WSRQASWPDDTRKAAVTPTTTDPSSQRLRFLQHRVGVFGFASTIVGASFLAYRALGAVVTGKGHILADRSFFLHAAATAIFALVWLLCRGKPQSRGFVRVVEGGGLVAACTCYSLMAIGPPTYARPEYIVILALALGFFARSIYVPSTATRTLVLALLVMVPLGISTWSVYANDDEWVILTSRAESLTPGQMRVGLMAWAIAWWVAVSVLCAAASRVIYGLRREVADVRKLGQYGLERKLGEGGMGTVYVAHHAMLRRPTAVKLLPPEKAGEANIARFEREVRLTARLTHPNTITIFDYGRTPEGVFYYAMELLDGATLQEVVELSGSQPVGRVVHVLRACAGALREAHSIGLIHRDIKPANIMLCKRGGALDVPKLLDFGLVKDIEQGEVELSRADTITGTPQYLSPESIIDPERVDGRSDIYALGAVGYFLLAGEHVFDGDSVVEVCSQHLHEQPTPPSERRGSEIPGELERTILSCLAKDPDERPSSAAELLRRLDSIETRWSRSDAESWWDEYGPSLETLRSDYTTLLTDRTLGVDIRRRTKRRTAS